MAERKTLLRKLVVDGHLNVEERLALGTLKRQEVREIVRAILCTVGAFPIPSDSPAVYEGARLVQIPQGVQIVWERPYAWDPRTVAERRVEICKEAEIAIEKYIESHWRSGIDGILLQ